MIKRCTYLLVFHLFICFPNLFFAQSFTIEGKIIDENKTPLEATNLVLLSQKDTLAVGGGKSDSTGFFQINNASAGDYWLMVTYLGYLPIRLEVPLEGAPRTLQIGTIKMQCDTKVLGEVSIVAEATPVVVRNDTIFYNTASFKTRPNAAVLELLKKLPGVEVSADGKITAQGKLVENVLVDGRNFCGDDPATSTRVLPADAIATVEIYDESSKKADFTGIDDPNKEKTINLILKEDRKKGWFGEAYSGAGGSKESDKRYDVSLNMNRFAPNRQQSVIGSLNNIGGIQSGFQKNQTLSLSANQTIKETTQASGNLNWNNSNLNALQRTTRQVFLPSGNLISNEETQQEQKSQDIAGDFSLFSNPDTLTTYNFRGAGNWNQSNGLESSSNRTLNEAKLTLNAAQRKNINTGLRSGGNMDFFYGRRAKKSRRNFTISSNVGFQKDETNAQVFSENTFFGADSLSVRLDTIYQNAKQENNSRQAAFNVSFGEPIGKDRILQADYSFAFFDNQANLATFDLDKGNERRNDSLSNTFFNRSTQQNLTLQTQIKRKVWTNNFGLNTQITVLKGNNGAQNGVALDRTFWRILPSVSTGRQFGEIASLNLDYRTDLSPPDLIQLQAAPDRRDPLNIREGNPNLKPSIGHHFVVGYNAYNPGSFRSFFSSINVDYTQDRIVETITVDPSFVRRYRPQNMQGEIRVGGNLTFSLPKKKWKSSFNFGLNGSFSKGQAFLNDRKNSMENGTLGQSLSWDFAPKSWLTHYLIVNLTQNNLRYSVDKNLDQSYFDQNYSSTFTLILPKRWDVRSEFNLNISQGRAEGFNQTIPLWNLSVSKRLLSGDRMEISLAINDLLNRNVVIQRNTNLNFVEDIQSNILSRYFFLKIKYTMMAI
jgi:Outer membrane protein beta-barrel family/Carboxypeptidase regulatory-like domain